MSGRDEGAPDSREDAAWREIVENFGDRAELAEPAESPASPAEQPVVPEPVFEIPAELAPSWEAEEHYVPPPAPPVHAPEGLRLLAWLGLFGVPAIGLICIVAHIGVPSLITLLFVVSFVASFGYLVATMDRGRDDDGWDDGAVL